MAPAPGGGDERPLDGHAIRTESEFPRCVERNASTLGARISHNGFTPGARATSFAAPCSMRFSIPFVVPWLCAVRVRRRRSKNLLYSRRNPLRL